MTKINTNRTDEIYDYYFKGAGAEGNLWAANIADKFADNNQGINSLFVINLVTCISYILQGLIYEETGENIQALRVKELYNKCIENNIKLPEGIENNIDLLDDCQSKIMSYTLRKSISTHDKISLEVYKKLYNEVENLFLISYNRSEYNRIKENVPKDIIDKWTGTASEFVKEYKHYLK